MRVFSETGDDGVYVTIRLDEDEYEHLRRGEYAKDWDLDHQTVRRMSAPPGEIAVFLEALGNNIVSYARAMSPS